MDPMSSKYDWVKKLPVLLGFMALFLVIPLTVFLTLQRQEIRKGAAPATSLELVAPAEVKVGDSFDINIRLNTGNPSIPTTGTDVVLKYIFTPSGTGGLVSSDDSSSRARTNVANPASVYCEQVGGRLEIRTDPEGGQYGMCLFSDGSECEEWALYRGECQSPASALFSVQEIIPGNLYDAYPIQEISPSVVIEPGEPSASGGRVEGTIKISGSASGLDKYFVGEGLFARLQCTAGGPGKVAFEFVWKGEGATDDTNVVGLVEGSPQEQLSSRPAGLVLDVVSETRCAQEGEVCYGFTGIGCCEPLACVMEDLNQPDRGGICQSSEGARKGCSQNCGYDTDCPEGLVCGTPPCPTGQVCAQFLRCYNPQCPSDEDCNCEGSTPTPVLMPVFIPTPTPTPTASARLNFDLTLAGIEAGFDIEATIYGLERESLGELKRLGSAKTNLSGRGRLDLAQENIGKTYQLFVRTASHLRKGASSTITIHMGDNYIDFGNLIPGDLFVASGETEQDNVINNFDVAEVLKQWDMTLETNSISTGFSKADLNRDGTVNTWDLKIVFGHFDQTGTDLEGAVVEESFCGGIAGIVCPEGYECQLEGNYPDASGTCVPITFPGKAVQQ
jgi:putative hemolysin